MELETGLETAGAEEEEREALTSGDAQLSDRTVSPMESGCGLVPLSVIKYLSRSNLREERLIWGSQSRGCSPPWPGGCVSRGMT